MTARAQRWKSPTAARVWTRRKGSACSNRSIRARRLMWDRYRAPGSDSQLHGSMFRLTTAALKFSTANPVRAHVSGCAFLALTTLLLSSCSSNRLAQPPEASRPLTAEQAVSRLADYSLWLRQQSPETLSAERAR